MSEVFSILILCVVIIVAVGKNDRLTTENIKLKQEIKELKLKQNERPVELPSTQSPAIYISPATV